VSKFGGFKFRERPENGGVDPPSPSPRGSPPSIGRYTVYNPALALVT
jgi:hypothetical protein